MKKTFKYRIFPTHKQVKTLNNTLKLCCWLYNHFLQERKAIWNIEKRRISQHEQSDSLVKLKLDYPFLSNVYGQVLQNVSVRIEYSFKSFFRRLKIGDKPGYPRFRSEQRYNSLTFPQYGFRIDDFLHIAKIGKIKINKHRDIAGKIKTCTIIRSSSDKWFVCFSCELSNISEKKYVGSSVGIDMGLETFVTFSDGEKIKNPRFLRKNEKSIIKYQRKLSFSNDDLKTKTKSNKVLNRIHEKIENRRKNFLHQESRKIIDKFDTIFVEDLSINNMRMNGLGGISKSIGDAAWGIFLNLLTYKAEEAGKRVIKINPSYTSQICSNCGNKQKLTLSARVYICPACGLTLNRDINAARNIHSLGLQGFLAKGKAA